MPNDHRISPSGSFRSQGSMGSVFAMQSLEMQEQHVEDVFDSKRKGAEGGRLGADKGEDAQADLDNSSMKHGFVKNGDVIECVSSL